MLCGFLFKYSASVSIDFCLTDIAKRAFINAYNFFIKEILFKILAMPHSLQDPSSLTKVNPRPPALKSRIRNHWLPGIL